MTNSNGLWRSVSARDANADGLFVYAVRSTGIYCRPSCPSRRPRRDRVQFFPNAAMAAARGYRPCRRCHPDVARPSASGAERVRRACQAIAQEPDAKWPIARLARAGGASMAQLQRAFRRVLGLAPREYVAACRRREFLSRLRKGRPVTDAIYEAGYGSPSRVYGALHLPGMTPATYGRGGRGVRIQWATGLSPIGRVLVAATDRGLCFVEVGASDVSLASGLRAEFPAATVDDRPSANLRSYLDAALSVARATAAPVDLPVDVRGTAFQWRVWRALTQIPRGETRSYSELAAAIGQPAAARAVARACATNPLALLVPCHRVVGQNGDSGGYRWGRGVKKNLLENEGRRG